MQKRYSVFMTVLFALLLLGCADKKEQTETEVLTIYTYDAFATDFGPAPKIKAIFEKKNRCILKFVGASSSISALRKIQIEGKKSKADILLGLDTATVELAKETGLFEEHGQDLSLLALPISYNDAFFLPFDYGYFAFVYDSDKTKNPPHSFEALASMPDDFKIVIQDPRSSTAGLGLLLWIKEIYGEKAGEYWKRLSPHILTITKGWSEAYGLFLKGEADMAFSYTTSPAYHIIDENRTNYKAADFKEGHYAQIEVAAILKQSHHKMLAKKFMKFLISQEFASIVPTANWAYPAIKSKMLPKAFEGLHVPSKVFLQEGKEIQKNKKHIIDEWLKALR